MVMVARVPRVSVLTLAPGLYDTHVTGDLLTNPDATGHGNVLELQGTTADGSSEGLALQAAMQLQAPAHTTVCKAAPLPAGNAL